MFTKPLNITYMTYFQVYYAIIDYKYTFCFSKYGPYLYIYVRNNQIIYVLSVTLDQKQIINTNIFQESRIPWFWFLVGECVPCSQF